MKRRVAPKIAQLSLSLILAVAIGGPGLAWAPHSGAFREHGYTNVYKQSYYFDLTQGSKLSDDGHYEKSIPHFENAVEHSPTSVIGQYNLGYSLMQAAEEATSAAEKAEKLEKAEWAFLRVRDLNPELTLTYYKLGKLALMREDFKAAADYYRSGVDANPDNFALYFNLAAAYEKLDDLKQAEDAYLKAIEVNPQFVYAHNNLGLLYEQTNRPEKAEAIYREALAQDDEYNYARLNLGSLLQAQGRFDEAETIYKEAIKVEPDNAWAHLYLGNTYYRQGNFQAALTFYQKSIELNPKYPTTYYLVSLTLQKLDRNDEALATGMYYINLAPNGTFSEEANDLVMTLQQAKERASAGTPKP